MSELQFRKTRSQKRKLQRRDNNHCFEWPVSSSQEPIRKKRASTSSDPRLNTSIPLAGSNTRPAARFGDTTAGATATAGRGALSSGGDNGLAVEDGVVRVSWDACRGSRGAGGMFGRRIGGVLCPEPAGERFAGDPVLGDAFPAPRFGETTLVLCLGEAGLGTAGAAGASTGDVTGDCIGDHVNSRGDLTPDGSCSASGNAGGPWGT